MHEDGWALEGGDVVEGDRDVWNAGEGGVAAQILDHNMSVKPSGFAKS